LGPLVNPYLPERQFIGTAFADLMEVIFQTGIKMGKKHLIVVRGHDGLDEISVSTPTRILEYRDGKTYDYELRPEDFGIEPVPFHAVAADNQETCIAVAKDILAGKLQSEHYKLVAVNAAFIYSKMVENIPLPEAYQKMKELLKAGAAGQVLEQYKMSYNESAVEV
jgi:anthranilate phosphoribosyltransferase